ncbi:MAG: FAD:protein FMN transferase [Bacillota bacterium]|nr:FAD:protein FMN transferase [Bacillota bacterium]
MIGLTVNGILLAIVLIIIVVLIIIFVTGKREQLPIEKEFFKLGTINHLRVYGKKAQKAVDKAAERVAEIEDKMSVFKEFSEVSRINKNAGGDFQRVSSDTYFIMKKSFEYSNLSKGAFDPTIRPIVALWGIGTKQTRVPSDNEIKDKLKLVNYRNIILDEDKNAVKLKDKNQHLDVGAIAKGYAADEVRRIFQEHKIKSAMIDLGGNIFAYGRKLNGEPWNIGIQNPLSSRGAFVGMISVVNKSIVTSGNYERYFTDHGKRYHHIMDPRTGYPCENGIISCTVISDNSIDGDALTTCGYVMGLKEGYKLIESIEGVDAIFVTEDKKVYVTSGIKENFKLLDKEFSIGQDEMF